MHLFKVGTGGLIAAGCLVVLYCVTLHALTAKAGAPTKTSVPFVNAADFGAKPMREFGDAAKVAQSPDATAALQVALDAGAGATVFVPKGAYRVTRPLAMKAGTTLIGEGLGGTVLTTEKPLSAVVHLKGVNGPMTVIRDLFFAGPLGGNWQCDAIYLEGTNGVTIRDCWFGAWRRAVYLQGVSDHWLRNLVFELNQEGVVVAGGGATLGRCHGNLRMFDCYGYQNYPQSSYGLLCDSDCSDCTFADNVIRPTPGAGPTIRVAPHAKAITIRPQAGS